MYQAREKEERNTAKKDMDSVAVKLPIYPLKITQRLNMLWPKYIRLEFHNFSLCFADDGFVQLHVFKVFSLISSNSGSSSSNRSISTVALGNTE